MHNLMEALSCIALIVSGTASVMESVASILRWRRAKKNTPAAAQQSNVADSIPGG